MLMVRVRIGIIGYAYTVKLHARAFQAWSEATLVAVSDPAKTRLEDLPAEISVYEHCEDLLATNLDAVSICVPTYLHCKLANQALLSGKHVLVEKPIAINAKEARSMLATARLVKKTLYVGMTHRFYPELREAKELLDAGAIGEALFFRDCILEHFGFLNSPDWYLQRQYSGGGVALTSGIHLVDRLHWFTNDEVIAVSGSANNVCFGTDVEDTGQLSLRFRGAKSAQVTMAFFPEPHPLVCDLEIFGTRGSIVVHTWQGYEMHTGSSHHEKLFYTDETHVSKVQVGIDAEVREFCRSIVENRDPWPTADESTRALEVVMAYYEAIATGETVKLRAGDAV